LVEIGFLLVILYKLVVAVPMAVAIVLTGPMPLRLVLQEMVTY
jgi:hypothetical protein